MRTFFRWIILLVVAVAAYTPGLHGPFVFDDYANFVENPLLHIEDLSAGSLWQVALSGVSSDLKRPVSMLSFGLNYALAGSDSFSFKLTNLVIHLLNAGLAGLLVLRLIRASPALRVPIEKEQDFALMVAAIWTLHPIQVTAVLYVVQRMTSLSALFTLLGLVLYVSGREKIDRDSRSTPALLLFSAAALLCLPLAVLSKENGILMAAYVVAIELFIFGQATQAAARARSQRIASAILVMCVLATASFVALSSSFGAEAYEGRGETMIGHLLTEGRALGWYLRMIFLPDLSQLGLIHDDWAISTSLFDPPITAVAWLLIAALILAGWRLRTRIPALGFGIAWFLAGHALESSILPLELVFEHRNYLPSLGLIISAASLARSASERLKLSTRATTPILVAIPLILAALTASRAVEWRSSLNWAITQAERHPRSQANQYSLGVLLATMAEQQSDARIRDALFAQADDRLVKAVALNPAVGSAQVGRIRLRAMLAQPIPEDMLESLKLTLHARRFSPTTESSLLSLAMCAAKGNCMLSEAQFQKLVQITLDSPYCSSALRAMLLVAQATYYGQVLQNSSTAIHYARQAVATLGAPSTSRFTLVKWLVLSARYEEALSALAELDQADTHGRFRQRRLEWRRVIDERIRASKTQ